VEGDAAVVGIGSSLALALGAEVDGLRTFPQLVGAGLEVPSTPAALWCWLRGEDRGELVHRTRTIRKTIAPDFRLDDVIDAFQYGPSLDLTGYEDGTENPVGKKAVDAGIVGDRGEGLNGSSFVAVQTWVHDLDRFQSMPPNEQDETIGRRKSDNEEIDEAPSSAHVKRTAQESFDPEAFVLRRSMPWADATREGLVFVAFGKSFDAFEALLKRMVGAEDGITDALFRFTRPITGSYFWCPPVKEKQLDLGALGL
jgi:putative iron-dependent peroxidase